MQNGQQLHIRPACESDTASANEAVNAVAAEKRYLATVDGFSFDETRAFLKRTIDGSLPQVLALVGDDVVGFCDIIANPAKGRKLRGRKLEDRYQDLVLMALWL